VQPVSRVSIMIIYDIEILWIFNRTVKIIITIIIINNLSTTSLRCVRAQSTTCDRAGFVLRRRYRCTGVCRGRQVDRNCRRRRAVVVMLCIVVRRHRCRWRRARGKRDASARRSAASFAGPPQPLDKKYYYTTTQEFDV